jgi:HlyD family secretion protein
MPAEQRSSRTVVHPDAIVQRNGENVVFIMKEGKVLETPIETGGQISDMVEVRQGLKPGDKVVLRPRGNLDNGDNVRTAVK